MEYQKVLQLSFEEYLFDKIQKKEITIENCQRKGWVFPYLLIEKGTSIIIYGAGTIGRDYYKQLIESGYCKEVRIVDQAYQKYQKMSLENIIVEEPELVFHTNFDYIIIAIKERQVQKEIKAWLVEGGIQPEAIQCFG